MTELIAHDQHIWDGDLRQHGVDFIVVDLSW